jgi:hypothetical protein
MNFGDAIKAIIDGKMVTRSSWKDFEAGTLFIFQTVGDTVPKDFIPKFVSLPDGVKKYLGKVGADVVFEPSITSYDLDGKMHPGWQATVVDIMATDWEIFEP